MSFIDEVREKQEESYDKWFERWYGRKSIESQIKKSAMQGYSATTLRVSEEVDGYTRRRLGDARVIEKLKGKLPGFDIKYAESSGDKMFLNSKVGTWYKKVILISWEKGKTND